jgi:hypothetical protein
VVGSYAAAEQEQREKFIYARIMAGSSIVGVYPPNAETLREYQASRAGAGHDTAIDPYPERVGPTRST